MIKQLVASLIMGLSISSTTAMSNETTNNLLYKTFHYPSSEKDVVMVYDSSYYCEGVVYRYPSIPRLACYGNIRFEVDGNPYVPDGFNQLLDNGLLELFAHSNYLRQAVGVDDYFTIDDLLAKMKDPKNRDKVSAYLYHRVRNALSDGY